MYARNLDVNRYKDNERFSTYSRCDFFDQGGEKIQGEKTTWAGRKGKYYYCGWLTVIAVEIFSLLRVSLHILDLLLNIREDSFISISESFKDLSLPGGDIKNGDDGNISPPSRRGRSLKGMGTWIKVL